MSTSMVGELPTVEVAVCAGSFTRQPSLTARAAPERKRIAWDHCSAVDLTAEPHSDFHESGRKKIPCTGEP